MTIAGPHQSQRIVVAGEPVETARAALIMVHGRGATADSILTLVPQIGADDLAILAPQAAGQTWYPYSFLAPIPSNEPGISSGIALLAQLVDQVVRAGVPAARVALLGFSQGACLTLEYAARNARRFGAIVGLSGGLIGPDGTPRDYAGGFGGTPVFLGCSDVDAHIPAARVHETAEVLTRMGAVVDKRLYAGMGHLVNDDELAAVRALLASVGS